MFVAMLGLNSFAQVETSMVHLFKLIKTFMITVRSNMVQTECVRLQLQTPEMHHLLFLIV